MIRLEHELDFSHFPIHKEKKLKLLVGLDYLLIFTVFLFIHYVEIEGGGETEDK